MGAHLGPRPTGNTPYFPRDPFFNAVSLLLHGDGTNGAQNNTFLDSSTNNFTITRNGNVTQGSFSPFAATSAYSTSVNGGSMYFDGTGDSLKSNPLGIYSTNFTVEAWIYIIGGSGNRVIATTYNVTPYQANTMLLYVDSANKINFGNGLANATNPTASPVNTWIHVAGVYTSSNTTLNLYVNGISVATLVGAITQESVNGFFVGGSPSDNNLGTAWWNGYISNLRVVKAAVYTANFTPSTTPLTAITNTSLLLSGTNAGIYDNAIKNNLETVGNAQVSTSVKKYGTGSMAFDGTGDLLKAPDSPQYILGTGNFTIEMWVYTGTPSGVSVFLNKSPNSTITRWLALVTNGGTFRAFISSNNSSWDIASDVSFGTIATSTWQHIALVRNGTSFVGYVNGVGTAIATSSASVATSTDPLCVGGYTDAYYFNGYIDDLRITKGVSRYTANFTSPTSAFLDH